MRYAPPQYGKQNEYKNGILQRVGQAEGALVLEQCPNCATNDPFIESNSNGIIMKWFYEYNLKDHLGNTRVTFKDKDNNWTIDPNTEISQINHYYPFGLNMEGNWNGVQGNNKYQYNGIELNNDFELHINLAFFRAYDPTIGRWLQIDPKPTISESSYSGFGNNPIKLTDPLGDTTRLYSLTGSYINTINDNLPNEDHFISWQTVKGAKGFGVNTANFYRQRSKYFIGANTRAGLKGMAAKSTGEGQNGGFLERPFFLAYSKSNRELQVFDVTKTFAESRDWNAIVARKDTKGNFLGTIEFMNSNPNLTLVGFGHTHVKDTETGQGLSGSHKPSGPYVRIGDDGSLNITEAVDYNTMGIVNPFTGNQGGNPSFISSYGGYSIYPSLMFNGADWDASSIKAIQNSVANPKIYDFNGNLIYRN